MFPDPRFLLFVLQTIAGYKNAVECLLQRNGAIWAIYYLQLLSNAVAAMAEMEVIPQEEMANLQGMKVFAVERPGLPEDFVPFPALCGVQSSPLVICSKPAVCSGSATVVGTGGDTVLEVRVLLS